LGGAANDCHGYRIVGHRLEFLGVCPDCLSRNEEAEAGRGIGTVFGRERPKSEPIPGPASTATAIPSRDNTHTSLDSGKE
jgi:hypothetical protein